MPETDVRELRRLLKAAIEAAGPDLRKLIALPRRAKVTAVKPAGGTYVCSVQPVLNDGRPDPKAPVIPDVEIPVIWAGPDRGIVCPPKVGEFCDVGFYDGDPNWPFIMNFRPSSAPAAELDGFVIQHSPDILLGFEPDGTAVVKAPKIRATATESIEAEAPEVTVKGRDVTMEASVVEITAGRVTVTAPLIQLEGQVAMTGGFSQAAGAGGSGGIFQGQMSITDGGIDVTGDLVGQGNVEAGGLVKAGGDMEAGGLMKAGGDVEAGGEVKDSQGNVLSRKMDK